MAPGTGQEHQSNSAAPAQSRAYQRPAEAAWGPLLGRLAVGMASAVCLAFLTLPLLALMLRVPLADLPGYLTNPLVLDALRLSLVSSLCSLALMALLGTPVAWGLARSNFPGKRVVETLVELPLVLPPAVAGVALLFAFGRRTPLGGVLRDLNMEVAFTLAAVVMAQAFVAAPFYIKSARAGFQSVPRELVEAAQTQGAGGWQTFRHIVVPLALPSIAGGAVMGWARAVGEFGATILFAGNFQGRTQTMPLAIYTALETDINAAVVLAAILVVSSFALLITFKLLSGRQLDVVGLGE
ncbi:MAG TPA: ABC transporter permease [Chloroflexia bacterium]|nr:ABC transporter permease [Chloroflexia bacterium]